MSRPLFLASLQIDYMLIVHSAHGNNQTQCQSTVLPPRVKVGPGQSPNTRSGGSTVMRLNHRVCEQSSRCQPPYGPTSQDGTNWLQRGAKEACGSFVTSTSQLPTWPVKEIYFESVRTIFWQIERFSWLWHSGLLFSVPVCETVTEGWHLLVNIR